MTWQREEAFLECQTCGIELKRLSCAEQQRVAQMPHNYIVYCSARCRADDPQSIDRWC